jgi:mercuric reductase
VVADAYTDEVLGVSHHRGKRRRRDLRWMLAVRFHLTVKDLTDTFAPYLTMTDGLKPAAQTLARDVSKLSCCAAWLVASRGQ